MSDLDSLFAQASSLSVASSSPAGPPARAFSSRSASPSSPLARAGGVNLGVGRTSGSGSLGAGGRFGRSVGVGLTSKLYSVVRVSGSLSSTCFGSVGVGNASFCVRQNCVIKAHVDSKIEVWSSMLDDDRIFIERSPGSTVFSEPFVGASQVPTEVWSNWQRQQFTLAEWNREFCAIEIANDATASLAEIKEEASFLVKAKDFRTPSKRAREASSSASDLGRMMWGAGDKFLPHARLLPVVETEDELNELIEGEGVDETVLTKVVSQVESSMVALGEALGVVTDQTHNRFVELERESNLVAGAVHTLVSSIGSPVDLDDRFEAPTLWGTTTFIADEVVRMSSYVMGLDLEVKPLQIEVAWIKTVVNEGEKKAADTDGKMRQIISLVMQRLQNFIPELEGMKSRIIAIESDCEETRRELGSKRMRVDEGGARGDPDSMDNLLRMLGTNSIGVDHVRGPEIGNERRQTYGHLGSDIPVSPHHRVGSGSSARSDEGGEAGRLFRQLIDDVALLKACARDKSVKFGGMGFRTIQDCQGWINDNFSCLRYGLFMDPLLMLDRICGDDEGGTRHNQFKTWEARTKLKISTGAEQAALQAISCKRPHLFHTGKTAMVSERNKSKLNQLLTFSAWKSGGEGVRNYVVKQMNVLYGTITNEIDYALGYDPVYAKAHSLAVRSLNDTITFLTQMMNFVDTIYEKLLNQSKFTMEQAWSLTTQILDRICEELYAPKEGVGGAMTIDEPKSVCAHILWACFRTHDVMNSYIESNFENHPVVSAEYVKFLATNSGFDKVEKLESQLSSMSEKLAKALDESKKAVAKADAASAKCAELGREMAAMAKKVKSLEDRK